MAKKVLDEKPKKEAEKALEAVEKEEKEAKVCKKCSAKKIIIPIVAVVVAAVVGFACFIGYRMLFGNNPVKITTKAIRGLKDSIKDAKDDSDGLTDILEGKDPYEISTKVTLSLPQGMGKYNLNALIQADSKNEEAKIDLNAKQNGKAILDFNSLLSQNKFYFKLADTMKNYYYLDITNIMNEFTNEVNKAPSSVNPELLELISKYDYTKLIDYAADAVDSAFDKSDFKKSKETIVINDKDVKATKYTAKLTQEKLIKVAKAFAKKAKDDKDLVKILAAASGEKEATILYSVYVSSLGKTLGCGFELENLGSIIIASKGDVTTATVKVGEYYGTINIDEKDDDHLVITANFMGMITAELDIKSDSDTVKKNKEYKETLDIKLNISALGQSIDASLNATTTVKKISKVDQTDVKDAINLETMSYAQEYQFQKEVEKSSIYKLIEGLSKTNSAVKYNTIY